MDLLGWIDRGLASLALLGPLGWLSLFWFTALFELPRYILTFAPALILIREERRRPRAPLPQVGRVSILLAGHNEADSIETCVNSLAEQTFTDFEIVCVSDGSTDATYAIMKRLQREGKVHKIAECAIRGGKSAAINLGMRLASGDIVVVIDCDCSFNRGAIEELIRPFADPTVGAVGGSVLVRNGDQSIVAGLQAIEYGVAIQLGKTVMGAVDQLAIISGAFGAFRRSAFMQVGMMDPGPGEDGDLTMRLRIHGYRIAFAVRSVAYTDVPTELFRLLKQRERWERDALWTRLRKYRRTLDPRRPDFRWREVPHQIDYLVIDVAATLISVPYLVWLFTVTSWELGLFILLTAYLGLLVLDIITLVAIYLATGRRAYLKLAPLLVIYGPFKGYLMRYARLYCWIEEWIYSSSRNDNFAPPKVNAWIRWK